MGSPDFKLSGFSAMANKVSVSVAFEKDGCQHDGDDRFQYQLAIPEYRIHFTTWLAHPEMNIPPRAGRASPAACLAHWSDKHDCFHYGVLSTK